MCQRLVIDLDVSETAVEAADEELPTGTMVGDYQIDKVIGYGGMGIVYGAVHPKIGKRAAIKVLNSRYCADQESVSRFVREAQAVNKIGHANIVDIFAFGELADGRRYLAMEWLQGQTLMDRLETDAIPRKEVIDILIALTRALEAAHNAGVIHRDLKPENIFLVPEDDTVRVKLLDFGIAKLETTRRRAPTSVTATGMTVGTPLYMSPEQAKGMATIDGRSDIYSLGVLAYAMLCRTTPFEGEPSPVEVLHAHISKPPPPPRERVPDLSPALDTLVVQMLAKKPEDRPTLAEIRSRLKAHDAGFEPFRPRVATDTLVPQRSHTQMIKRRSQWPVAIGVIVVVLCAGGFFAWQNMTSEAKSKPAPPLAVKPAEPEVPPPVAQGTLELVVEPATATVSVAGKPVPLTNGRATIQIPGGQYAVSTSASGYRASEQTVAVTSADVTALTIKLTKQRVRARPKKDVDAVVNPFKKKRPR
jgi:serine/threonine protein kinase